MERLKRIAQVIKKANHIYTFGNGGSGATASHLVNDLVKLGYRAHCLNDNVPLLTAIANDMGYKFVFSYQLSVFLDEGDIVIAFSGSGNSPNIIEAINIATGTENVSIGFTGMTGGELAKIATYNYHVPGDMQDAENEHLAAIHDLYRLLK